MKKTAYIQPSSDIIEVQTETLIADSMTINNGNADGSPAGTKPYDLPEMDSYTMPTSGWDIFGEE